VHKRAITGLTASDDFAADSSLIRAPDVDEDGKADGYQDYSFSAGSITGYAGKSYFIDKQLAKMYKAGVKVVSIEMGGSAFVADGRPYSEACTKLHVDSLVARINAHPEYGLKFLIAYTPLQSRDAAGVSVNNSWCTRPSLGQQFQADMDRIYDVYVKPNPSTYFRPYFNNEYRPAVYVYAAKDFVREDPETSDCQNRIINYLVHAKNYSAAEVSRQTQDGGRLYLIGDISYDLRSDLGADYYTAYKAFDAAHNMGDANIYSAWSHMTEHCAQWNDSDDTFAAQRVLYQGLNQYTLDLENYLLKQQVLWNGVTYRSRVDRFAAMVVPGEPIPYRQNYYGGMSVMTNTVRRTLVKDPLTGDVSRDMSRRPGCSTYIVRSILGQDGDYVAQLRNQMNLVGRRLTRIDSGTFVPTRFGSPTTNNGNAPFGLTLVMWNPYDEGAGIETNVGLQDGAVVGGDLTRGNRCRPELPPLPGFASDPAPSFPYSLPAQKATAMAENCTGDFFIDGFKQYWNLVFWLPQPVTSSVWNATTRTWVQKGNWASEQSGYEDSLSVAPSGVTVARDAVDAQWAYVFPADTLSTAFARYRASRWTNGYTAPGVTGLETRFSVEATIRREPDRVYGQFRSRKIIASNWYNYVGWNFMIGDGNRLAFLWTRDGQMNGTGGDDRCPNAVIADRNWHKVAATMGGGTLRLYIDNNKVCELPGYAGWIENVHDQLTIGNIEGGASGWMGSIRDVKVYSGRLVPEP